MAAACRHAPELLVISFKVPLTVGNRKTHLTREHGGARTSKKNRAKPTRRPRAAEPGEIVPSIRVRGARVHNLKNIDVDLPRDGLVVLDGRERFGKELAGV